MVKFTHHSKRMFFLNEKMVINSILAIICKI
nr:MAG TPA: hypothetical protein [Caudoviricetes sp.]